MKPGNLLYSDDKLILHPLEEFLLTPYGTFRRSGVRAWELEPKEIFMVLATGGKSYKGHEHLENLFYDIKAPWLILCKNIRGIIDTTGKQFIDVTPIPKSSSI